VQHLLHAQPSLFSSVISATSLLLSLLLMISCGLLMFGIEDVKAVNMSRTFKCFLVLEHFKVL